MTSLIPHPEAEPVSAQADALAGDLRALVGKLKRRLREQASAGDFTPSQLAVLQRLERDGPATVSSLARAEGMRPQSMGTVVAALESAGLLTGAPDPADGRQTLWSLTDAFANWMRESRAARQDWLARTIEARLTGVEQQELAHAIKLLQRLVQP
ncbi:MarR family transcriptional regulator [Paraburkholderia eburnea]|uniref:MarR family transcriptional regulator n=1 Tax=Paraburkholderia eburnea TaxID=1189126 RepID=A0A2S4LYL1_9BURK|nr:MarR family transcriptional regulator [Paraburkholderia eburnea]POR47439.1 MarR family transcriptional regulator [Paraburkholderia eburnea]PRZ19027.1 MarR family transcriptional regulator [Paraburkholderia eburnea]